MPPTSRTDIVQQVLTRAHLCSPDGSTRSIPFSGRARWATAGEACGLRDFDVDLEIGQLTVLQQITTVGYNPIVRAVKSRAGDLARVVSVFAPAFRLSSIISVTVAGTIVSLMRPGHRFPVAGMTFGRIDVIYLGTGVIFLGAGMYALFSLRNAAPSLHVARRATRSPLA
ncbi:MAG: hypothetical protein QOE51_384 [Actinoplanes sp.]|nr:hypothetical protein [Actinoplanes sp.]